MDASTKAKINMLLRELRTWDVDESRAGYEELAAVFALDPFIVKRIMQSEGVPVQTDSGVYPLDREADTQPVPRDILSDEDKTPLNGIRID